jgi:hypothetical protein
MKIHVSEFNQISAPYDSFFPYQLQISTLKILSLIGCPLRILTSLHLSLSPAWIKTSEKKIKTLRRINRLKTSSLLLLLPLSSPLMVHQIASVNVKMNCDKPSKGHGNIMSDSLLLSTSSSNFLCHSLSPKLKIYKIAFMNSLTLSRFIDKQVIGCKH